MTGEERFSLSDQSQRDLVLSRLRECIRESRLIAMDPRPGSPFFGTAGSYQYVFEGEDDLLHLRVEARDGHELEASESQPVARFLLSNIPEAMVWLRPGKSAHHYYFAHDLL